MVYVDFVKICDGIEKAVFCVNTFGLVQVSGRFGCVNEKFTMVMTNPIGDW